MLGLCKPRQLYSLADQLTYEASRDSPQLRPLCDTLAEMRSYYSRITARGKIKNDDIFTVILLYSISDHFTHLQQTLQDMTQLPIFNSEMIAKCILDEDARIPLPIRPFPLSN